MAVDRVFRAGMPGTVVALEVLQVEAVEAGTGLAEDNLPLPALDWQLTSMQDP
jgi:hypothetical protein